MCSLHVLSVQINRSTDKYRSDDLLETLPMIYSALINHSLGLQSGETCTSPTSSVINRNKKHSYGGVVHASCAGHFSL